MQKTNSGGVAPRSLRLKTLLAVLLCGFLTAFTVGCGDSDNSYDGIDGGPYQVTNGGFLVQLSANDLAVLFPDENLDDTLALDPDISDFRLYAFDVNGNLVASSNTPYFDGDTFDETVDDLPPNQQFDIVIAGVDNDGNLISAAEAPGVFPLTGGLQLLQLNNFGRIQGFVIP